LRVVSRSFDDAANAISLSGYEVPTVRAAYDVSETVELYGRVENLWDEDYQTAAGYATRGRAAFVGARLRL
jgi:vitamin B12 transporter